MSLRFPVLGGLHGGSAEQRDLLVALIQEIRNRVAALDAAAVAA